MNADPLNLIWIDLEMTGLMTDSDRIIEIATVVTDKELNVIAEGPVFAIHQDDDLLDSMDNWNTKQHGKSGLTQRVRESKVDEAKAERETIAFLQQHVLASKSPMCGNSICQDRRFLARCMPDLVNPAPDVRMILSQIAGLPYELSQSRRKKSGMLTRTAADFQDLRDFGKFRDEHLEYRLPIAFTRIRIGFHSIRDKRVKITGDEMLPIMFEFVDRVVNVRQRQVAGFFFQALENFRRPAHRQFFQAADIQIAVMKEFFEIRHATREKTPVLANAVATHR